MVVSSSGLGRSRQKEEHELFKLSIRTHSALKKAKGRGKDLRVSLRAKATAEVWPESTHAIMELLLFTRVGEFRRPSKSELRRIMQSQRH